MLLKALRAEAPEEFTWAKPEGGFYVWCRFPERVSPARLLARAAAERVSYLPGGTCFVEAPGANFLRLNFTYAPPDQLREGVRRLLRGFAAAQAEPAEERAVMGTQPIV